MLEYAVYYIVGMLTAASLLLAWFQSGLPYHVLGLLEKLGWNKEHPSFWHAVREKWDDALNVYYPNLLSELLSCPVCLSFHVSFWIGVGSLFIASDLCLWYPIVTALSWPILINILLSKVKHHD